MDLATGVFVAMKSALTYGATAVVKDLLKTILPTDLSKNIAKALTTFKSKLPDELSEDFAPESLISGLSPDSLDFESDSSAWREVHLALARHSIPTKDEWYEALRRRWEIVHEFGKRADVQSFYKLPADRALPHMLVLADELFACCTWEDKLFNPTVIKSLTSLHEKVDDLSGPDREPLDQQLNAAKALLDNNEYEAVLREMRELDAKAWGDLTPWQRWRLRTIEANALLRRGEAEKAGERFVEARQYAPDTEKAKVNHAIGLELLMKTAQAHEETMRLQKEYPNSMQLFAAFLRTLPLDADFESILNGLTPSQQEDEGVLAALSQIAGHLHDFSKQHEYAKTLVAIAPKWPGAHMTLAMAIQNKGWYSIDRDDRAKLLREAISHYSKAIEIAREKNDRPIEGRSLLFRANLRDYLGESAAAVNDFEEAFKADPNDPLVARKHAFLLIGEKRFDDAVTRARESHRALANDDTAFALAFSLNERATGTDCADAYNLISKVIRTGETVNSIALVPFYLNDFRI